MNFKPFEASEFSGPFPLISYIIPTRDRPERLEQTLHAIAALGAHDAEVIIVDNDSRQPLRTGDHLASGVPVRVLRMNENLGAAARNAGARECSPRSAWIVMLDDDSHPLDLAFIPRLAAQGPDVAAVSADIFLPRHARRESGGLPEVFVGCGVAIRRALFLNLNGYDPTFNYYAEEYDLAARMLLAGFRIAFEPSFRVAHHKVESGRDMNLICARLVRNNGWVMQRYAPEECRHNELREIRTRYRTIATKEHAIAGFAQGLSELRRTVRAQKRTPMPPALFDRFTGLAHAREALHAAWQENPFRSAALVHQGKNAWCVRRVLGELGVREVPEQSAEALVIATLSPGPMLDALEQTAASTRRVIAPWTRAAERSTAAARSDAPTIAGCRAA